MVAFLHILQNARRYTRIALLLQLFYPAFRPHLYIGIDEEFVVGIGTDDGTDIAAIQNRAGCVVRRRAGEAAL